MPRSPSGTSPPGAVRAYSTGPAPGAGGRMRLALSRDASRTRRPITIRFRTRPGLCPLPAHPRIPTRIRSISPLQRVFARPEDVADVAEAIVREGRLPVGCLGAEWDGSTLVRTAISSLRP